MIKVIGSLQCGSIKRGNCCLPFSKSASCSEVTLLCQKQHYYNSTWSHSVTEVALKPLAIYCTTNGVWDIYASA